MKMVGLVGLEPTTPALSRRCSNQLSYRPIAFREKRMDPGDARYATYSSICGLLLVDELRRAGLRFTLCVQQQPILANH